MKKKHILIVEDEALLYKQIKKSLLKANFSVSEYTPSFKKAIESIQLRQPDIALLDINLQGELSGLDLGKELHDNYNIPFMYITDLDDDLTFYNGINTKHESFLIKNEINLNPKNLVREIHTILARYDSKSVFRTIGVNALVDYMENAKQFEANKIYTIPIDYKDIALFSIEVFTNEKGEKERPKTNYLWLLTKEYKRYLLKYSLRDLSQKLPPNFVRVNKSCIVNIHPDILEGRINGSKIRIMDRNINISDTYKELFNKRYNSFYD